jgi:DnaJ-class molecular chaperone
MSSSQDDAPRYDPLARLRAGDWRARASEDGRCGDCDGYGRTDEVECTRCGATGTDAR